MSISTNKPDSGSGSVSKRRLSLFSFGSHNNTNQTTNSSNVDNITNTNSNNDLDLSTSPSNHSSTNNIPVISPSASNNNTTSSSDNIGPTFVNPSSSTKQIPQQRKNQPAPPQSMNVSPNTYNNQLDSPIYSPVLESSITSLSEKPDSNIFERSVQDFSFDGLDHPNSNKSKSSNQYIRNEDFIPPALDATTSILNDKDTDLDNIEMIYSNRRNSSVIGLNMALGRPFTPSRKNSSYSINQNLQDSLRQSSISQSIQPPSFNQQQQQQQNQQHQPQSPVSPPKLTSSKSSVSFYSYADMINNDEYSRRPSFKGSYSQGIIPTIGRKQSVSSANIPFNSSLNSSNSSYFPKIQSSTNSSSQLPLSSKFNKSQQQSQLSRQFSIKEGQSTSRKPSTTSSLKNTSSANLNKFLISPESSDDDSEDHEIYYPAVNDLSKRKSLTSNSSQLNSINDNESLVSTSIGDCIRQSTTEINGN